MAPRALPFTLGVQMDANVHNLFQAELTTSWFMASDKWEIHHVPPEVCLAIEVADQRRHLLQVRRWLRQWADTGSNPFIHERLYKTRFPRYAQDAFMASACYLNKTAATEKTVHKILEDRAEALISEYHETRSPVHGSSFDTNFPDTDLLESLARVQALLVYQIIGLYDGDIRLRHLAERRIPVLHSWMGQLLRQASGQSQTSCLGSWMIFDQPRRHLYDPGARIAASQLQNLLWYSWIMAESIRRTWLLCSSVQGIYVFSRDGPDVAQCQGGITFTTREGIWAAKTAAEWEALCVRESVRMVKMKDTDMLFVDAVPEEVDEFTKMIMQVVFGSERMTSWRGLVPVSAT